MNSFIVKRSRTYMIGWIIAFACTLLLGLFLLFNGGIIPGIITTLGMIASIALCFVGLINRQPRIVMDSEGVSATEFQDVKILWSSIEALGIVSYPRVGRIITFELKDEAKYADQVDKEKLCRLKIDQAFGVTLFHVKTAGLDQSPGVIYKELRKGMAFYKGLPTSDIDDEIFSN